MKINNIYSQIVSLLIDSGAIKATKYINPKFVIRAVRTRYGKRINKRNNIEISLTIGKPNFLEREFIKLCQKSGEPFPIKKIQLKLYNPVKTKLKKLT
jgi:hypothetical protein